MMRMKMWDEAPKTELLGYPVYTFGLYCLIGTAAAVAAVMILCRNAHRKKGTGTLLSLMSICFGMLFSRLFFSVLYNISADGFPFSAWFRISTGGWSLFGLIFGVFTGAFVCSKLTGEKASGLLDTVSCALPLLIAAERFGERFFEGFDISRPLQEKVFPNNTFLSVRDTFYEDISFLATYLAAAIGAILLFLIMVFVLTRNGRKDGDLWILFMMICGAGGILLESLRYDHFLEFSFVRFQQILAAVLMSWGVIAAAVRSPRSKKMILCAILSLPAAIGICAWIEFALDRTEISHHLLYAIMIASLAVPVMLGILLLRKQERQAA